MKLFLATHGRMASGMKSSIEVLLGSTDNLIVFDAYIDDNDLRKRVEMFFDETEAAEVKVLISDIYGGSVCQVLTNYIGHENTFVLTGVNLGIILSLLTRSEDITKQDLIDIINESKELTCLIDEHELNKSINSDDFF